MPEESIVETLINMSTMPPDYDTVTSRMDSFYNGRFYKYPCKPSDSTLISELSSEILKEDGMMLITLERELLLTEAELLHLRYDEVRTRILRWMNTNTSHKYYHSNYNNDNIRMKQTFNITVWTDEVIESVISQVKKITDKYSTAKEFRKSVRNFDQALYKIVNEARLKCSIIPFEVRYTIEAKDFDDPIWISHNKKSVFTQETVDNLLELIKTNASAKLVFPALYTC